MSETITYDQSQDAEQDTIAREQPAQAATSRGELVTQSEITDRDQRVSTIKAGIGGIAFDSMLQVMDFAKLMAKAGAALPPHLRENPGGCLAATIKALEWGFSPFTVANWQYEVENRGVKRVAYESQCYHAVIEARAPIKERLRYEILGTGDDRVCRIWFTVKGEKEPRAFQTETLGKLRPATNDAGKVKGSPLWTTKPEVQLFYNGSRDVARIYFPDIFGGVYTHEELEEMDARDAIDVTPAGTALADRLRQAKVDNADNDDDREGFTDGHAAQQLQENGHQNEAPPAAGSKTTAPATGSKTVAPKGKAAAKDAPKTAAGKTRTSEAPKAIAGPKAAAKPEAAPKPEPAPKPAADPKPTAPAAMPARPKNPKQYQAWVKAWLASGLDADEVEARWKNEMRLRNECNMTQEDREPIRKMVEDHLKQLGQ